MKQHIEDTNKGELMVMGPGASAGAGSRKSMWGWRGHGTWTQEQPRFILVSGKRFLNLHAELFVAFVPDPDNRIYLKYYLKRCQKIPRSEIALSPVHKVQFVEHKQQTNSSK